MIEKAEGKKMMDINQAVKVVEAERAKAMADRCERAKSMAAPEFVNKYVSYVKSEANGPTVHYYKVSIKPYAESCTCPDWIYRGKKNGVPCKHMVRALAERIMRDTKDNQ